MYETLILIDQTSAITPVRTLSAVRDLFEPDQVATTDENRIIINFGDFKFSLTFAQEPHVLIESQELAQHFAKDRPEQTAIAQCATRIEITAEDDPFMDRFNDYCILLEAIEKLGKVYTFDSATAKFVNLP